MINAKDEFIEHIGSTDNREVLCAEVFIETQGVTARLPVGYGTHHWNEFTNLLDIEYDDGYGCQELFGTIWYTDGTFSMRGEYDGAEWWDFFSCPEIPENLRL